jgi:hypothetical protein
MTTVQITTDPTIMITDLDIAWLAGVFDGEGCVYVQRSKRKGDRVVCSVALNIANTSAELVERVVRLERGLGCAPVVTFESRYTKKPAYYVKVARKVDALALAKALLPHATSKRAELQMAIWYLERSCKVRQHVATKQELEVLDTIRGVKHGEALPESVARLLDN